MGADTPEFQSVLGQRLAEATRLQKQVVHILALATASAKAAEQAALARRDLAQAIAEVGGAAFDHPELSPSSDSCTRSASSDDTDT